MSKFKVGDKVKVVDIEQISQWTNGIKVGYVGVVIEVDKFDEEKPYKVKLDKCYNGWWFTDKCIELIVDDTVDETKHKFKVGDVVKVTSTDCISQFDKSIEVGYVGVVIDVNVNVEDTPYKVRLDKCYNGWWFTESDLELVEG